MQSSPATADFTEAASSRPDPHTVHVEKIRRAPVGAFLTLLLPPNKLQLGYARSRASAFDLQLPPGRNTLQAEGGDDNHEMDSREVTVEPGKLVDLGEIKLTLSPRAASTAAGASLALCGRARRCQRRQPKDFKGKWVALEFWGYWCGPAQAAVCPAGWISPTTTRSTATSSTS